MLRVTLRLRPRTSTPSSCATCPELSRLIGHPFPLDTHCWRSAPTRRTCSAPHPSRMLTGLASAPEPAVL